MLDFWKIATKTLYLVKVNFSGEYFFHLSKISRAENYFETSTDFGRHAELDSKLFKSGHPIHFHLAGDHIISKEYDVSYDYDTAKSDLLGGSITDEFLIYYVRFDEKTIISAIRKNTFQELLNKIPSKNIVVSFSMGDEVVIWSNLEEKVSVEAGGNVPIELQLSNSNWIQSQQVEQQDKRKFNILKFTALGLFLGLLVFNDVWNHLLTEKVEQFQSENQELLVKQDYIETLNSELKSKQQFLQQSGFGKNDIYISLLDSIGLTCPGTIQLVQIEVNPLVGNISNKKPIEYNEKTIRIEGLCQDTEDVDNWFSELKELQQVKSGLVNSFEPDMKTNKLNFVIELRA